MEKSLVGPSRFTFMKARDLKPHMVIATEHGPSLIVEDGDVLSTMDGPTLPLELSPDDDVKLEEGVVDAHGGWMQPVAMKVHIVYT